jgi:hypothetical protein
MLPWPERVNDDVDDVIDLTVESAAAPRALQPTH